jgi:hypothetical protein
MFSMNCLLNIVTLAPVSIKNAKHLFCSLAFTKSRQINVQISLGKKFYQHNVFIAYISNEGILGMDFLAANNCDVHLSENSLCTIMRVECFL